MVQKTESIKQTTNLGSVNTMHVDFYLYNLTGEPYTSPAIALNNLTDAILTAIAPLPAQENQTLGGMVTYCRPSGEIITDEGVLGMQAVCIIPIEIEYAG